MELNFTGLTNIAIKERTEPLTEPQESLLEVEQGKTDTKQERPAWGSTEPYKRLQKEAAEREAEHRRTLAVYREYQENIKTSGQLQTELLKGAKLGEDIYSLFLKAAKAISLMTNNSLFYSQLEADIKAIYGAGLLEPLPLQQELKETQERLQRLREAKTREGEPADSKARIASAIKAHEARAEQIQGLLTAALERV